MLVEAEADEEVNLVALPLVLRKETDGRCLLVEAALCSYVVVVQRVVVVLNARSKLRGEARFVVVGVLTARNEGQVLGCAIGIGVHVGTEVCCAADALCRGVDARAVTHIGEVVELEATAVDVVVNLLADVGHVGCAIEVVATTAEVVDVVVLTRDARVCRGLVVGAEAHGLGA